MKKLIFSALAMAVMAGCTKENSVAETPSENELRISSSIQTRTIGEVWESGDEIGVYMGTTDDDDIYDFADLGANIPYTTIYGDGNFTSDSPLFLPSEGSVYIHAYYPYYEGLEDNYYPVDVTDQSDLGAIDLLVAKTYNIESSSDAVDMTFSHRLSFISLNISAGNNMTTEELEGLEVTLSGVFVTANVAIFGGILSFPDSDEITDMTLNTASSGTLAEAVVIPQPFDYSPPILYFKTKAGDTYSSVITTFALSSGKKYTYNITINKGGVQLSSSTINTWGDGTEGESSLNADPVE